MKFLLPAVVAIVVLLLLIILRRRRLTPHTEKPRQGADTQAASRHEGYLFVLGTNPCDAALEHGRKWKKNRGMERRTPLPGCDHPKSCDCRFESRADPRLGDRRMHTDRRDRARFEEVRRTENDRRRGAKPWDKDRR